MKSQTKRIFDKLNNEVSNIYVSLQLYYQVFGTADRVALINNAGGAFWGWVQGIIVENLIISVVRLLDPAATSGKLNLTMFQLFERLQSDEKINKTLEKALDTQLKVLKQKSRHFREYRHKRLGHRDLGVALGLKTLTGITDADAEMKEIASLLSEFLNTVRVHFFKSRLDHIAVLEKGRDGDSLLTRLLIANIYDKLVAQGQIKKHEIVPPGFFTEVAL